MRTGQGLPSGGCAASMHLISASCFSSSVTVGVMFSQNPEGRGDVVVRGDGEMAFGRRESGRKQRDTKAQGHKGERDRLDG